MTYSIIVAVIICVGFITYAQFKNLKKDKTKISFKESMDLTELPIVTFMNGDKKVNFLLDSGSNISYINQSTLPNLKYVESDEFTIMYGIDGNKVETPMCDMIISYKNQDFNHRFSVNNMDQAFGNIKQESGVQIHGILGSLFFQEYKYVLDFDELIAYNK